MRVPRVSTCCCGCTLETGTITIGWLYIIFSVLTIISGTLDLMAEVIEPPQITNTSIPMLFDSLVSSTTDLPIPTTTDLPIPITSDIVISAFTALFGVIAAAITLIVSIMLLIGVNKRIPKLFNYWIVFEIIVLVMGVLDGIITGTMSIINKTTPEGVGTIISVLIWGAIVAYLIIVVYNFKKKIQSDNQRV
ncbi:uncharacterized protein LOC143920647 [Arctopsyche grandis]|uniref:uncharacterized protein LOC143920647 n=1 Tax=Arctopsyche grandis TaxID=121162 RepID=UPI00406D77FA